jgi:hypothetical protein
VKHPNNLPNVLLEALPLSLEFGGVSVVFLLSNDVSQLLEREVDGVT